ncbi:MAG: 50S ribosomal protein L13 [Candidatus Nanoarchaeia archaeon]
MIIINAKNQIVGRLAAHVAKQAILGQEVKIINCEEAVVSGNKKDVLQKYKRKRSMGIPLQGPYYRRSPEFIVKRTIRGMLPYKKGKGSEAFNRIKCYKGVPSELAEKEQCQVPGADYSKITKAGVVTVGEISKELGARS